jgi:hypothetical protein
MQVMQVFNGMDKGSMQTVTYFTERNKADAQV